MKSAFHPRSGRASRCRSISHSTSFMRWSTFRSNRLVMFRTQTDRRHDDIEDGSQDAISPPPTMLKSVHRRSGPVRCYVRNLRWYVSPVVLDSATLGEMLRSPPSRQGGGPCQSPALVAADRWFA